MIKKIISISNKLDQHGLTSEADVLDSLIFKAAQMTEEEDLGSSEDDDYLAALTTVIENLKGKPGTEKQIEVLNSLLEDRVSNL
jgi:hypothetical protein